jgi:hypothetical protein
MTLLRGVWGYMYSNEQEVVAYIAKMLPILGISFFIDGLHTSLSGTAFLHIKLKYESIDERVCVASADVDHCSELVRGAHGLRDAKDRRGRESRRVLLDRHPDGRAACVCLPSEWNGTYDRASKPFSSLKTVLNNLGRTINFSNYSY